MGPPERSVLHVLPHPGGGGETYVDLLGAMPGYAFSRTHLASSPEPSYRQLASGLAGAYRRARGPDLVHVHGEIAAGLCLPLLATRPSVVTLHGLHLARRQSRFRVAAVVNLRAAVRAARSTICVSRAEHDYLSGVIGPTGARRAVVIHNGVPVPSQLSEQERAEVRNELGLAASEPVAIWVGSLDERKDPLTAIRGAKRAGVPLVVVGDGPLRSHVAEAAREPVLALGQRDDVARLLGAADLFVLTSLREGFAFSLLEAMAHGLVPVVTDLAENVEAVDDAGIVVRPGDEAALAAALRELVENESERARLSEQARRRVAELYDADEMIARTCAVYEHALGDRAMPRSARLS